MEIFVVGGAGSVPELVACALATDPGADGYWDVVEVLRQRGDRETLSVAVELARSGSAERRRLGVEVLGELGPPQTGSFPPLRPFQDEVLAVLLDLTESEHDVETLVSVVSALRLQRDPRAVDGIVRHVRHPEVDVRLVVAMVLPDLVDDLTEPPPPVVQALVELTADEDREVRNWAMVGLGWSLRADSPAIREALLARVDDPDDVTAGEALRALAIRDDGRILGALRSRLDRLADTVGDRDALELCAEAAALVGAESLLPALAAHHTRLDAGSHLGWLDKAIDRCARRRVLTVVEGTLGGQWRLQLREVGRRFEADLVPHHGAMVYVGYAAGSSGVLAAVAAELRWLAEQSGEFTFTVRDILVRARLDDILYGRCT